MSYKDELKKLRKRLLMTQTEFAQFLGVSFATINRWEQGQFEPTMKLKRKLTPLFRENEIEVE